MQASLLSRPAAAPGRVLLSLVGFCGVKVLYKIRASTYTQHININRQFVVHITKRWPHSQPYEFYVRFLLFILFSHIDTCTVLVESIEYELEDGQVVAIQSEVRGGSNVLQTQAYERLYYQLQLFLAFAFMMCRCAGLLMVKTNGVKS